MLKVHQARSVLVRGTIALIAECRMTEAKAAFRCESVAYVVIYSVTKKHAIAHKQFCNYA